VTTRSAQTAKSARSKRESEEPIDAGFAQVVEAFARDREVTTGKMMASVGLKARRSVFGRDPTTRRKNPDARGEVTGVRPRENT
jgi:hypothetical protein